MTLFHYQAVDAKGIAHAGQVESSDRTAALEALHRRGLVPMQISEGAGSDTTAWLARWRAAIADGNRIDGKDLLSFTQSLTALLKARLTVDRALAVATGLARRPAVRLWLEGLGKSVRAGRSLADALAASNVRLPAYYVGLVQAGEVGGNLPQTLSRLSELLRRQQELRERVRSALIYPAILAAVVLLTVVVLITFVLPRFGALFAESDAPLPWSTRAVLALGEFAADYWWLLAFVIAAMTLAAIMFRRSPRGRESIDAWLLRSRWTLGLPAALDTARLLRTLSTLLAGGVPLATSMRIGRATLANSRLRTALDEVAKRIKAGESISAAFAAVGSFPMHAVQLARVGEETGRLEDLLSEAATILEEESRSSLERLLTLLVPVLTVSMGFIIAALIGSVLVGLLSINDLAF